MVKAEDGDLLEIDVDAGAFSPGVGRGDGTGCSWGAALPGLRSTDAIKSLNSADKLRVMDSDGQS